MDVGTNQNFPFPLSEKFLVTGTVLVWGVTLYEVNGYFLFAASYADYCKMLADGRTAPRDFRFPTGNGLEDCALVQRDAHWGIVTHQSLCGQCDTWVDCDRMNEDTGVCHDCEYDSRLKPSTTKRIFDSSKAA